MCMQIQIKKIASLSLLILFFCVSIPSARADETFTVGTAQTTPTFRFNNTNWFTEAHPTIVSFTRKENGDWYGETETGIPFLQYNVPNNAGIRIQRFEIQDHYHYIVEGEIVYTLAEVSTHLAQAFARTNAS